MHRVSKRHALAGAVTLLVGAAGLAAGVVPAAAAMSPHTVYVAPHGTAQAADVSCQSAAFDTIQSAVAAVAPGGTVHVCGGTYREDVALSKPVALLGQRHAVINAAGKVNGVLVTAPYVLVTGFTVTGATGEGILVDAASHVTIEGNIVTANDRGGIPAGPVPNSYPACQAAGGVPGDCGEGIHLMGSSYSTVAANVVTGNTGGILLSDETGPTAHNRIIANVSAGNLFDCGITVVGHNPKAAPGGVPAPSVARVYDNHVAGNSTQGHGIKGEGAGVVLATALPGGAVYGNTVEHNTINGNGLSGVTVHSHVTGQFMNGNVVTENLIGVNNLGGDKDFAPHWTSRPPASSSPPSVR